MNDFVTVLSFSGIHDLPEITMLQDRLESEGLTVFIKDQNIVQVQPFYSGAVGGIKLQVLQKDVPSALIILKELGYTFDHKQANSEIETNVNRFIKKYIFAEDGSLRGPIKLIIIILIILIVLGLVFL